MEEGTRLFSCFPTTLNHTPDDWNPAQKSLESQMVFNRPPPRWVTVIIIRFIYWTHKIEFTLGLGKLPFKAEPH